MSRRKLISANVSVPSSPYYDISIPGATVTIDGDYKVYTVDSDSVLTVNHKPSGATVWILMVAGGGGGGGGFYDGNGTGGGAGGGVREFLSYNLNAGVFPITIGLGGAGGQGINTPSWSDPITNGYNGGDTVFDGNIAEGGGFGASYLQNSGGNGGNGGGAAARSGVGGIGTSGYKGGLGQGMYSPFRGGGGAGAGGDGQDWDSGSHGGAGYTSLITGTTVRYAGGGGGGQYYYSSPGNGRDGGGNGGSGASVAGQNGQDGFGGGGGGGGCWTTGGNGGNGGKGVFIIRVKFQN